MKIENGIFLKSKKIMSMLMTIVMSLSAASVFAAGGTVVDTTDNQEVIITDNETVLVKDVDYVLEYTDNIKVGEATVKIKFIGNYSGEKEQKFNIKRQPSTGGGGGGSLRKPDTVNVAVKDKDNKPIKVTSKTENDKIIVTLPEGIELDSDNLITVTVKDGKNKPLANKDIIVKDTKGGEITGKTDENGIVIISGNTAGTPSSEPSAIPTTRPVSTAEPEGCEHNAYIRGYEDGTFNPDGNITRAETASMLNGVIESDSDSSNITFSDLKDGAWYIDAVQAMTNTGIINGYTDGTFRPERHITRAEFVAMLTRTTKDIQHFDVLPFTDVFPDVWSADYIYTAYTNGYINGYEDGTFKPDSPITRAEAVKIINSVLGRDDFTNSVNPFSDVSDTHWAYKQILEAAVSHNVELK